MLESDANPSAQGRAPADTLLMRLSLAGSVMLLAVIAAAEAAGDPVARIESYVTHDNLKFVYHYRVTNLSNAPIDRIAFGLHRSSDPPEGPMGDLAELPSGTRYGDVYGQEGYPVLLDDLSIFRPSAWKVEYGDVPEDSDQEDRGGFYFIWRAENDLVKIKPGQTWEGFGFALDKRDDEGYLMGRSTILVIDETGKTVAHSIRATPIDTAAPQSSVTMSPASASEIAGTFLNVQAILTVTDDYDPQPAIGLESITATVPVSQSEIKDAKFGTDDRQFALPVKKDPTGKPVVYTITYSATDGTGNKRTTSATVTLNP